MDDQDDLEHELLQRAIHGGIYVIGIGVLISSIGDVTFQIRSLAVITLQSQLQHTPRIQKSLISSRTLPMRAPKTVKCQASLRMHLDIQGW